MQGDFERMGIRREVAAIAVRVVTHLAVLVENPCKIVAPSFIGGQSETIQYPFTPGSSRPPRLDGVAARRTAAARLLRCPHDAAPLLPPLAFNGHGHAVT